MGTLFTLNNISKYFLNCGKTVRAIDNVSLQVNVGEFVAIYGPSGSGKSTLLNLMGTLDLPTYGQLLFDGRDIACLKDRELSCLRLKRIGFVFQSYNLIPELSVLENVEMPLKYAGVNKPERERRSKEALEIVEMTSRLNHLPAELSGGEEQRVAIARALVNQPDVILADEPTGNLDTSNRDIVINLFVQLNSKGQTIIVVTHDETVMNASLRKFKMQRGKIVFREDED